MSTRSGISSISCRQTRTSRRLSPGSSSSSFCSQSSPSSSRLGEGTLFPRSVSAISPVACGTCSDSGSLVQANEPASWCSPGLSQATGPDASSTTGAGCPSTRSSRGQAVLSPGSGTIASR